jgi:hypothetical protein
MSKTVEVSDALYERLQSLAGGERLFTIDEVIERLLIAVLPTAHVHRTATTISSPDLQQAHQSNINVLGVRVPRQRGATVEVAGQRIHADTVADLYQQVLKLLLERGHAKKVDEILPYRTSAKRFLIAREPKHPNGNDFFVPVKVGSYYMEAHKNYDAALKHLRRFLAELRVDIDLKYVGS